MIVLDRPVPRRGVLLALLVGALLAGLVGMHHVVVGGSAADGAAVASSHHQSAHPGPVAPDQDDSHEGHGTALLHLCLAVLATVTAAVLTVALWWRPMPPPVPPVAGSGHVDTRPRSPPRGAPARLALLCVLRT